MATKPDCSACIEAGKKEGWGTEQLIALQAERTRQVEEDIQRAFASISADIAANQGIYPFNGGRLTQREVCRRAGIGYSTLRGKHHRFTTRIEVDVWLKEVKVTLKTGRIVVRRAVTDRIAPLKGHVARLAAECQRAQIEIVQLKARIRDLLEGQQAHQGGAT